MWKEFSEKRRQPTKMPSKRRRTKAKLRAKDFSKNSEQVAFLISVGVGLFLSENHRESEQRLAVADFVTSENVARTVNTRLMNVMRMTGFRSGSGVTAKSIRLGAAIVVLEAQGLETAALFLGNNSLDATARMLHYEWWVTK